MFGRKKKPKAYTVVTHSREEVLAVWRRVYDRVRPTLSANIRPGRETVEYIRERYATERYKDRSAKMVAEAASRDFIEQFCARKMAPRPEMLLIRDEGAGVDLYISQRADYDAFIDEVRRWQDPEAEYMPAAAYPIPVLAMVDRASGYVMVEGSPRLSDELFLYRGFTERELENLYIVYRYAKLSGLLEAGEQL